MQLYTGELMFAPADGRAEHHARRLTKVDAKRASKSLPSGQERAT